MFEFLLEMMKNGNDYSSSPNVRFPVSTSTILDAEERLRMQFPSQLRAFFEEIGCGFLKIATGKESKQVNYINRFLEPLEIADLIMNGDTEIMPSEGFSVGDIPFFEVGDMLYLVISPTNEKPNQICWPDGDLISEDLITFTKSLMEDPRFYQD